MLEFRRNSLSLADFLSLAGLEFSEKCWKKGCINQRIHTVHFITAQRRVGKKLYLKPSTQNQWVIDTFLDEESSPSRIYYPPSLITQRYEWGRVIDAAWTKILRQEKCRWPIGYYIVQGDKKSTQQVNYGKTTHFISKYSCWSPKGIRGDLDFSHADHFFTSTCAQWANLFFKGRKFEIDLRVKQKQIKFLFPVKST